MIDGDSPPGAAPLFQLFPASEGNRHRSFSQALTGPILPSLPCRLASSAYALHALLHLAAYLFHAFRGVDVVKQTQPPVIRGQRSRLLLVRLQPRAYYFFAIVRTLHELAAVLVANSLGLRRALVNIVNLAAHFAGPP